MFKFFRRLKSDRSENNHEKNSKQKSKKDEEKLSTLGNSSGENPCAVAIPPLNDVINKAQVVEDQVNRKRNHLRNFDNVFVDENVDDRYKKEKSSRNEIVDLARNDRTSPCRNQDDRSQTKSIDHKNQSKQQHGQHHSDQQPLSSFNPINKSREFFYEIMGKNRNRNRNKNKHNKYNMQGVNQQNKSNERTHEECEGTQKNSERATDETSNKEIHKNLESKNEIQNFQNFGYQITKSQNRSNLIMKYESEDEDSNENIEKKSGRDRKGNIDCDGCNRIEEDQREVNCADASSDVKSCENRILENEESHESNNSSISHTGEEVIIIGNLNLRTEQADSQCNDHKEWHPLKNSDDQIDSGPLIDVLKQISELTECDRDQQYQFTAANMGQDNSKNSFECLATASGNVYIDNVHSNLVIPTITVADYSDQNVNKCKSNNTGYTIDNDVFYDTESFDNMHHLKVNQDAATDDWQFVACESDQVIIEDDPDPICDGAYIIGAIPTTVIDATNKIHHNESNLFRRNSCPTSENLSNTSSSSNLIDNKHHTDSPDSGIEILDDNRILSSTADHLLNISRESELFARDSSTDCDDNFLLYSDNDHDDHVDRQQYYYHKKNKHKPIVIDSISLPDVVVESTSSMGNSNSIKTVEHIEDHKSSAIILTDHNDNETRDLVNQEARYSAQLEEAQKIIFSTQTKVNELQSKIDNLEKELSIKSWNVDRLQAELQAAHKEDECVRRRLKLLQEELGKLKQTYSESEDDLQRRYDELETRHMELQEKYQQTKSLASTLQTQLAFAQSDTEQCRLEKQKLCEEKVVELKNLEDALENSQEERKKLEEKWQMEFELLRTQNADTQEHLLSDCEWQLRTMQKTCKEKVDAAQKAKNDALEKATEISTKATEQFEQLSHLLPLEAEVRQLRGLTNDQRESLLAMTDQLVELRSDLEDANKQLEDEINNVRKIRLHCDNALSYNERQMLQKIEEARGIVAVQWENRLLEEMTRLKNELESVHAEERRDALDKLQIEHIEEIKVLTCRYDANEEELRNEISTLSELLEEKSEILSNLKTKTDAALLQTRMHLDRADTEYMCAMNREMEKKEQLAEQLQSEFAQEKLEMEERFRERLDQVKDEFTKELANATEEMASKHQKQLGKLLAYPGKKISKMGSTLLEQQWEKLVSEKEEALQTMENRHRIRLEEADNRIKDLEIQHQRDLKEIRTNFEIERTTLESRDLSNSQEIEQLHRKCRCLTNLFEEMRMRYERRDPRPEDLRDVAELRERCESQERDLQLLTERLREIQIERENNEAAQQQRKVKASRKPIPKNIPTNCDVIYEESEERESPFRDTKEINEELDARSENEDGESEYSESSEIIVVEG